MPGASSKTLAATCAAFSTPSSSGELRPQVADWVDPLSTAKQNLAERALANEGIESLDGKFKEVRDAAIECGLGEHFSLSYKVLAKFAHPTAMRILKDLPAARRLTVAILHSK